MDWWLSSGSRLRMCLVVTSRFNWELGAGNLGGVEWQNRMNPCRAKTGCIQSIPSQLPQTSAPSFKSGYPTVWNLQVQ